MDLWLITGCVEDIKAKIIVIDKLIANENDIDWGKVKVYAEMIQEQAETLADELYEA